MEIEEHLGALAAEGTLLAAAAERVDHAAPVAGCPAWPVGAVLRHVGLVHRWAARAVRTGSNDAADYPADDGSGLAGPALVDWLRTGHAALVDTLAAADPGVRTFTFLPAPSPLAFWARRQTHETGIHRADVESGGGPITPFDRAEALDGIAEMMDGFAARRPRKGTPPVPPLGLLPTDAPAEGWLVRLGGTSPKDPAAAAGADCVVRGTASDLHLLLWNRPAEVAVTGDPAVLDAWRAAVQVRWGGPGPGGTP